jgi:rhodanese-related sulfurtransferase
MRVKDIAIDRRARDTRLARSMTIAVWVAAALLTVGLARAQEAPADPSSATPSHSAQAADGGAMMSTTAAVPSAPVAEISPDELARRLQDEPHHLTVLDVRTAEEFAQGHVPGAINIPLDQLGGRTPELKADGEIIVYCLSGGRAQQAIDLLRQKDFKNVVHLSGDYPAWQSPP